jgi:hypothetical protein
LRQALQTHSSGVSRDARSVNTLDNRSGSPGGASASTGGGRGGGNNSVGKTQQQQQPPTPTNSQQQNAPSNNKINNNTSSSSSSGMMSPSPANARSGGAASTSGTAVTTPFANRSAGTKIVMGTTGQAAPATVSPNRTHKIIYAWEGGNNQSQRSPVELNGVVFLPSKQNGFYSRQDTLTPGLDTTPLPEKYVDFQIILTEEELTTLANRKKTIMSRVGHGFSLKTAADASLHISTPYVDPRRIHKDLLRPVNPDKWISSDPLRVARKGDKF